MNASERRAQIEARRAKVREASEPALREEAEQRELEDLEALAALEEKYGPAGSGEIEAVKGPWGIIVVRRPDRLIYDRYMDTGKYDSASVLKFVSHRLEHPSLAQFEARLDKHPGLLVAAGDAIALLGGAGKAELLGK